MNNADIQAQFRDAMRNFPAAVSIISCMAEGKPAGITVTAVSSLSLDPPSLLVCINRSSSFYSYVAKANDFCVNVLQPCHENVAAEFAGRTPQGSARFLHGRWAARENGTPCLADARINILCRRVKCVDYGTHAILIGEVVQVLMQGSTAALYHNGNYGYFAQSDTVCQSCH